MKIISPQLAAEMTKIKQADISEENIYECYKKSKSGGKLGFYT